MRLHPRTLLRSSVPLRANHLTLIALLPIVAAVVAACGNGSGGSAY